MQNSINNELPVKSLSTKKCYFVSSESVTFKDKETGENTTLYKTHFLTSNKELLTYWLKFPLTIETSLPEVEIVFSETLKNEKFTLTVKDVIVL